MRIKLFFITVLITFSVSAQVDSSGSGRNKLPEIGVVASSAISIDKELIIGDVLMRQLRGQAPILNDPILEEYINELGNRLVSKADNVKFPFNFFLINNAEINAFAFFGGNVGVHTGLIVRANTESELASVLAHEIAHVTQRHIARRVEAQQRFSPIQIASTIAGLLLATLDTEAGIAALTAGNASAQQYAINYTRSNEQEADRIGFRILSNAGFDPKGAANFFRKLASQSRFRSSPLQFLLTHPLPESRITDARIRAESYNGPTPAPSYRFHLAKNRLLARFFGTPELNVKTFQKQLDDKSYVFKQAAQYGLALSLLADEQPKKAKVIIDQLLENEPDNLFFVDTATDILLELEDKDSAVKNLQEFAKKSPRNRVVTLNLANAAIKSKDYESAVDVLKDYLLINPDHLLSHQLLSDAYQQSNKLLEMHQTNAEIYALLAAYPRAIDELHTAYNFAKDSHIEKQRIRARIDQLRVAQDRLKEL